MCFVTSRLCTKRESTPDQSSMRLCPSTFVSFLPCITAPSSRTGKQPEQMLPPRSSTSMSAQGFENNTPRLRMSHGDRPLTHAKSELTLSRIASNHADEPATQTTTCDGQSGREGFTPQWKSELIRLGPEMKHSGGRNTIRNDAKGGNTHSVLSNCEIEHDNSSTSFEFGKWC